MPTIGNGRCCSPWAGVWKVTRMLKAANGPKREAKEGRCCPLAHTVAVSFSSLESSLLSPPSLLVTGAKGIPFAPSGWLWRLAHLGHSVNGKPSELAHRWSPGSLWSPHHSINQQQVSPYAMSPTHGYLCPPGGLESAQAPHPSPRRRPRLPRGLRGVGGGPGRTELTPVVSVCLPHASPPERRA